MQRAVLTSKQEEDKRSVSMCGCGATRALAAHQYPETYTFCLTSKVYPYRRT
jgi:hypothetical protein